MWGQFWPDSPVQRRRLNRSSESAIRTALGRGPRDDLQDDPHRPLRRTARQGHRGNGPRGPPGRSTRDHRHPAHRAARTTTCPVSDDPHERVALGWRFCKRPWMAARRMGRSNATPVARASAPNAPRPLDSAIGRALTLAVAVAATIPIGRTLPCHCRGWDSGGAFGLAALWQETTLTQGSPLRSRIDR